MSYAFSGEFDADLLMPLRRGSTGSRVRELQALLGIAQDGIFGVQTETALKTFQNQARLPVTGVADQATMTSLKARAQAQAQAQAARDAAAAAAAAAAAPKCLNPPCPPPGFVLPAIIDPFARGTPASVTQAATASKAAGSGAQIVQGPFDKGVPAAYVVKPCLNPPCPPPGALGPSASQDVRVPVPQVTPTFVPPQSVEESGGISLTTLLVAGGLGALALGGIAYLALRKRGPQPNRRRRSRRVGYPRPNAAKRRSKASAGTVRHTTSERAKAQRFWDSMDTSERNELGDQLVWGTFDWRDWGFESKPSSAFMLELDQLRMLWES